MFRSYHMAQVRGYVHCKLLILSSILYIPSDNTHVHFLHTRWPRYEKCLSPTTWPRYKAAYIVNYLSLILYIPSDNT